MSAGGPLNDPTVVSREYESEDRFLARRLNASASVVGPLVEDEVIRTIDRFSPKRMLEVGAGTGDFSERLSQVTGVDLVALDLSERMVSLIRARGLQCLRASIEALPFADSTFNCVLANRVLYHLSDLNAGLSEVARVLEPDGNLVAVTYGERHLGELWDALEIASPSSESSFSGEQGTSLLAEHFRTVRHTELTGSATFMDTGAVRRLLDSYGEFASPSFPTAAIDRVRTPFQATYRHSLLVARRPQRRGR